MSTPQFANLLSQRVYEHAVRYGTKTWADSIVPEIIEASEDRRHKALDKWTPTTIYDALVPRQAPYTEKETSDA